MRQPTLRAFRRWEPKGGCSMTPSSLGSLLHSFFDDYLRTQKGLRPNSLKSYADAMALFLQFASKILERKITNLKVDDLSADLVSSFLHFLEESRGNTIRAWLGHTSLETTNRYAEITLRTKQAALEKCVLPGALAARIPRQPAWHNDAALL